MAPESSESPESAGSDSPVPHVWVIVNVNDEDEVELFEAHVSEDSAEAASKKYQSVGYAVQVKMIELKSIIDIETSAKKDKANSKKKSKKAKKFETEEEEEDGIDANEDKSSSKTTTKNSAQKTIPEIPDAKPNALKGLRLLFIGTMDTDRKTLEATAAVHGGLAIRKVEDSDYAVVGTRPSSTKIETINKQGLDKITEAEFFDLIRFGVPEEKRESIAAREANEPPKKKQKR